MPLKEAAVTGQPSDLTVEYQWCEGTVPPPDYYEYTIRLEPGSRGVMRFRPDYPQHDPPEWEAVFDLDETQLGLLLQMIRATGLLAGRDWPRREDGAVGGPLERLKVTLGGRWYIIPAQPAEPERLAELYRFIRSLVPESVRREFHARHAAYGAGE
jgi:hypothetical protein